MVNVNEVKVLIDTIANKEQSGMPYTIDRLNELFDMANNDLFKLRYGLPEEYQPGSPVPRMAYENTQKIKDDLKDLKSKHTFSLNAQGEAPLPDNYIHKTEMYYTKVTNNLGSQPTSRIVPIEVVDDDKWAKRMSNNVTGPDVDFPIARIDAGQVLFEPKNLQRVEMLYLRYPVKPVWAFTLNANGVEQYDSANSINFEWNQSLKSDIVRIILGYLGISLREEMLLQYAENTKRAGY